VDIEILSQKAAYDGDDFTRRWAAHVEARFESIKLAAQALKELADCSPLNIRMKPRNTGRCFIHFDYNK
jgi:hypothetical protein